MTHWVLPAALQPNITTSALKGVRALFCNEVASNTALRAARESLKLDSERRALSITCISLQQAQAQEGAALIHPSKTSQRIGRGHGAAAVVRHGVVGFRLRQHQSRDIDAVAIFQGGGSSTPAKNEIPLDIFTPARPPVNLTLAFPAIEASEAFPFARLLFSLVSRAAFLARKEYGNRCINHAMISNWGPNPAKFHH